MEFKAKLVPWEDIEKWCLDLKGQIIRSYRPEVIVGMARGGLVPARLLSDYLWIKDLFSVKTEHWGITATVDGAAKLSADRSLNVAGRRVLVVDDITDTGGSMKLAREFVESLNPAEVKTATLLHIDSSEFAPDFYAVNVPKDQWTWFIFPWNVHEDLLNLLGKILNRPMSLEEIVPALLERFNLAITEKHLAQVLDQFAASHRLTKSQEKFSLVTT